MKNRNIMNILLAIVLVFCCNQETNQDIQGNWNGCMVGIFTSAENGNFPLDGEKAIIGFEKLIDHETGSVMWFPTWDDPFPISACKIAIEIQCLLC